MRLTRTTLAIAVGLVAAAVPALGQPAFEMSFLPPLQTEIGEFASFLAWDMNDKGQVAGQASGGAGVAAARYSRARGMEDLDPDGSYRSTAQAINAKGEVLGLVYPSGNGFNDDVFLYRPRTGFDFLEQGKTDEIVENFIGGFLRPGNLPRSGNVFGSSLLEPGRRLTPFIYTKRAGWTDLSGVHPRFAAEHAFAAYTNNAGHQVFFVSGQTHDDPPEFRQELFLRLPNGRVLELESPGKPVMSAGRPNKKGRMAGLYRADDGRERAFVFTPARGVVDIHPDGFPESIALGVNDRDVSYGALKQDGRYSNLFLHTDAGGLEVVVNRAEFEELAADHPGTFGSIYPEAINKKNEVLGCVYMRKAPDFAFLYSPTHGLIDLSEVALELDPSVTRADGCTGILNNKSQMVLTVEVDGERTTAAILKLVG